MHCWSEQCCVTRLSTVYVILHNVVHVHYKRTLQMYTLHMPIIPLSAVSTAPYDVHSSAEVYTHGLLVTSTSV